MQLTMNLTDRWGRPVSAEVRVRRETVEVWCAGVLSGSADRDHLRSWLADPAGVLVHEDVAWIPAPGGVAVALAIGDDVPALWLDDHLVRGLREQV